VLTAARSLELRAAPATLWFIARPMNLHASLLPLSLPGATERALTAGDAARAQRLVVEAGWNQLPADWELMLRLGRGFGIEDAAGTLIATALTLPLGEQISWISMVLVASHARRSGLGSHLLRRCLEHVQASGRVAGLDATELGRPVYLALGFRDLYRLQRLVFDGGNLSTAIIPPGVSVAPLADGDMAEVIAWDREISGFARRDIVRDLQLRMPQCAWLARRAGRVAGYVLAREGLRATQLGPVLAEDGATAALLTATAAQAASTPIFIDVPEAQTAFTQWLGDGSAIVQRGFTRMLLGTEAPFDRAERLFAIAGPELG
jgi:GNAT superfamily N-acetyltransferase